MCKMFGFTWLLCLNSNTNTTQLRICPPQRHTAQTERFVGIYHNLVEIRGCCYMLSVQWCLLRVYFSIICLLTFPPSAQSSTRECPGHCNISWGHLSVLADPTQRCSEWQPAGFQGHLLGEPAWWRYTFISVHCFKTWAVFVHCVVFEALENTVFTQERSQWIYH